MGRAIRLFMPALAVLLACLPSAGQTAAAAPPKIKSITPDKVSPGLSVELEGSRLGAEGDRKLVRILFLQNGEEHEAGFRGGFYQEADLRNGRQDFTVTVPDKVTPGPCQVVVEVAGRRSEPFEIEVNPTRSAPTLNELGSDWANPGEGVWLYGFGFSDEDECELSDAHGQAHVAGIDSTSDANVRTCRLPSELPEGEATLRVVETQSGFRRASNPLVLRITRGPPPPAFKAARMKSVAPGQWLAFFPADDDKHRRVTRVDVSFRQGEQSHVAEAVLGGRPGRKTLRFQLPPALAPGDAQVSARAWAGDTPSSWSRPFTYRVADGRRAPIFHNLMIVPVRAEARFREEGKTFVPARLILSGEPRVLFPDGLTRGRRVELQTRAWRDGRAGEWTDGGAFTCCPADPPDGTTPLLELTKTFYVGPDAPPSIPVHAGEGVIVEGELFVESAGELQVILRSNGQQLSLRPETLPGPSKFRITIPRGLSPGLWRLAAANGEARAELSIGLRVE